METVEVLIKLPKELYQMIKEDTLLPKNCAINEAIQNGTVLPKGHGRLIDADKLRESQFYSFNLPENYAHKIGYKERNLECQTDIANAPTIIEADSSAGEKLNKEANDETDS